MLQKPLSILISGAGIAGSSLALILARKTLLGLKPTVTLIERSPKPRTTGQAIDIRGPAIRVIRELNLEDKIKARHTSEVGIAWVNSEGKAIARIDTPSDGQKQNTPTSEYEILRGELAALLLEEVDAMKGSDQASVRVVYGESIKSLIDGDDGVAVEFANGRLEAQKFDVVISADGMSSRTREMMFEEYTSQDCIKPQGMYIAYFTVPRAGHDEDLWKWYSAPAGLAIHLRPHRNKTTMGVYLSITSSRKEVNPEIDAVLCEGPVAQKKLLQERFKDANWEVKRFLEGMEHSDDFYMQQVAQVSTPRWTKGRCAISGDSAHCVMGMGTSLAILDAYVIAGELSKITSSNQTEIAAALRRYEEIVRPLAQKYQKMPPGVPQFMNPQTKLGVTVLRTSLRLLCWTGLSKLMQGFGEMTEDEWEFPLYE